MIDPDITKPIVIDLKVRKYLNESLTKLSNDRTTSQFQDLDSSSDEEEDFQNNRKLFQNNRSVSAASKKSISFFDMDSSNKDDNLRHVVPYVRQITEDGKAKLEIYRPTTNPIYIYTQV